MVTPEGSHGSEQWRASLVSGRGLRSETDPMAEVAEKIIALLKEKQTALS
jgi:hypothetical protein